MISADTNIFVHAANKDAAESVAARQFLQNHESNRSFVISEFVLVEIYMALRNPAIFKVPLSAASAVTHCTRLRLNPFWQVVDEASHIKDRLWHLAATSGFAFRRIVDARIGVMLAFHGVTEFATVNVGYFQDCGFSHVWNPLKIDSSV